MDAKFAVINALEEARESLQAAQIILQDVENRVLDEWVQEAEEVPEDEESCTHDCFVPNAFEKDEPLSFPLPR